MTRTIWSEKAGRVLLVIGLFLVCPTLVCAQSNNKKPNSSSSSPAPAQKPTQQPKNPGPTTQPKNPGPTTQPKGPGPTTPPKGPSSTPPPRPVAKTTPGPNGSTHELDAQGRLARVTTQSGAVANFDTHGKVTAIHTASGATITHTASGARLVTGQATSPSGQKYTVVSNGAGRGYVQRSFTKNGQEYERRTYVYQGHTTVYVYRNYYYHGYCCYYGYVPGYYYGPAFYGWAYAPWAAPVPYAWGWYGAPWYGYYGYYWTPFPVYASAAYWMTDYILSENLQAAYDAGRRDAAAANQPQAAPPPAAEDSQGALTPEVKEMIAEEVKQQLAAEQAAAEQGASATPKSQSAPSTPANGGEKKETLPPALDPNIKVFIVSTGLTVDTADGQSCALSPGDVLMRTGTTPDAEQKVTVSLASRQKSDCKMDTTPRVLVADLQEMHNHFQEQMDSGLKSLAAKQGTKDNPFPNQPPAGSRENPEGQSMADDKLAIESVSSQQKEADQAETEVQQATATGAAGGR